MSFNVIVEQTGSPKNAVDKTITAVAGTYPGTLKEATSIIDPVFIIQCDLDDCYYANYLEVPQFGRKYFIKNIRSVGAQLVEFSCHVDVLASFKNFFIANPAIIKRNENANNILLNDGYFKVYQNPHIVMYEFPNGFTEHEFILAMAGSD